MKLLCKFATLALTAFVIAAPGLADAKTKTENLVKGVIGPVSNNVSWPNYTVFNLVPGSALYQVTSTTTRFYLGFTAGTTADISNMVVYTTARGSLTLTAVTPVKLGGLSNPSIDLASTSVCPVAPSSTTPCIVPLDTTTLTLAAGSDYYLAVFFTNDSNNSTVGGTQAGTSQSSLAGMYFGGGDRTNLTVGEAIPSTANSGPTFLMYVMNE